MEDDNNLNDLFFSDINKNGVPEPPRKRMDTKMKIIIAVVTIIAVAGVFVIGLFVGQATYHGISKDKPLIDEVYELAKQYYIEDISDEDYDVYFAAGLMSVLDRYTGIRFIEESSELEYGVSFQVDDYSVKTVESVKPLGSASGVLMRGDIIEKAIFDDKEWIDAKYLKDDIFIEQMKNSNTAQFVVNRDGTPITLDPITKGSMTMGKEAIYLDTDVEGVGYIRLESFTNNAIDDFMSAIYDFELSDNYMLILDIRDNPGGSTDQLAYIVNNFIPSPTGKDPVIKIAGKGVFDSTTYAKPYEYTAYGSDGTLIKSNTNSYIGKKIKNNTGKDFKMAVVANDRSASAAEAFIGNIMHYMNPNDYVLLGESKRTFGKGIAQADFPLKNGNNIALHMTIGKYTVLGKYGTDEAHTDINIHGIGYELDDTGITKEIKSNYLEENAIIVAGERLRAMADAK